MELGDDGTFSAAENKRGDQPLPLAIPSVKDLDRARFWADLNWAYNFTRDHETYKSIDIAPETNQLFLLWPSRTFTTTEKWPIHRPGHARYATSQVQAS